MNPRETCPTCGTKLGPLHEKNAVVRCESCQRINPRGFLYCGYCATPIETEAQRAELAEVAAPPGGWPNLARELRELRFFQDRGELDEAYELLAILRARHPGHPELAESRVGVRTALRPDTQVNRVVDSVLAGSSLLASAMSQPASPPSASASASGGEAASAAAARSGVRKRVLTSDGMRRAGAFPVVPARPTDSGPFATVPPAADPAADVAAAKRSSTGPRAGARSTSAPFSIMPKPVVPPAGAPRPQVARTRTDRHFGVVPVGRNDDAAAERAEREVAEIRVEETVVGLPPMAAKMLAERIARFKDERRDGHREANAAARTDAAVEPSDRTAPASAGAARKPTAAELAEAELAEVEAALEKAARAAAELAEAELAEAELAEVEAALEKAAQSARAAASAAAQAIVMDAASAEAELEETRAVSNEAEAAREPTATQLAEAETAAPGPGLTVAVPTLQPPAPYRGGKHDAEEVEAEVPTEVAAKQAGRGDRGKKAGRKRAPPAADAATEGRASEATPARRRIRGDRFGQHVLGRFGKKGKG